MEEIERIGPFDAPRQSKAEDVPPEPTQPSSDEPSPWDIETLGANLRNAEDILAYMRMSEMGQNAHIRDLQLKIDELRLSMEKIKFFMSLSLLLVGVSMMLTLISLLHVTGLI